MAVETPAREVPAVEKTPIQPLSYAAFWALIVLVIVNIMNFYDRNVAGALAEPISREFHLNDTAIGWLGTVFTILYAVIGLPLGQRADRGSRKVLLAAGVAIWGALTACAYFANSFSMLVKTRLGVAVGEAACAPTAASWIGDLFPPHRRAKPLALFMLGVPVGGALAYFLSGVTAQHYGWRIAMIVAAAPAVLIAPVILLLREPRRGASDTHKASTPNSLREVLQVFRIPTFWWIIASGALVNFNLYAIGTFLPLFFSRIHHVSLAKSGYATGAVYAVGGIMGGVIAGYLGDFIIRHRSNGRMTAAALATLTAAPLAYFGVQQPLGSLPLAVVLITLAYGCLNMYYGLVYSSIQDVVAPSLRGTIMSIYFCVMYLGGASFGPVITGKLSDHLARSAAKAAGSTEITAAFKAIGLQHAMLVIPALSLALAMVLWAGSRTISADVEKHRAR
ncbi:MAG TPA: MFS transporter [Candidatus Angelobacter sp.]|jgi:MFS family permease|nr:MFS transporter [Candidatus Angelobacter sp.]